MMLQLTHPDLAYAHARAHHAELLAEAANERRARQVPPRPSRTPARITLSRLALALPAWLRPHTAPAPAPVSSTP
jgi:hypothetical protein